MKNSLHEWCGLADGIKNEQTNNNKNALRDFSHVVIKKADAVFDHINKLSEIPGRWQKSPPLSIGLTAWSK